MEFRAFARKVSDAFTVPLCVGDHDALHFTCDERAWWAARKIDPLGVAPPFPSPKAAMLAPFKTVASHRRRRLWCL
jgi:hypothetical protein